MITPIDANNKKGIYKDLYREINSDNAKVKSEESPYRRQPKGIYKNLYNQIGFSFKEQQDKTMQAWHTNGLQVVRKEFNSMFSKISYFFSSARSDIKMLMLACMVAKKPINSYIDNNIQ